MVFILFRPEHMEVNSLWPSDVIWQQRSGSILPRVMASCLMAPNHYLNQCWLIVCEVLWYSPDNIFMANSQDIYLSLIWDCKRLIQFSTWNNELTRYVDGMPTSEVTPVTIRYIRPPHRGHTSQYHGHEWMTRILFVHCQQAAPFLR